MPFWFWNDRLDETELLRQLDDFQSHGIHGFVIHPRVGLPRDMAFMSNAYLAMVRFVVDEAARRKMRVILYDEGMYPSGSASGQVVAENPAYQCRGLCVQESTESTPLMLEAGQTLIASVRRKTGTWAHVIDRPVDAVIRGLHYIDEASRNPRGEPAEDTPPAADLLNPAAVACFIRLVYDRFYEALKPHFGTTIIGIFTDEPDLLGRLREPRQRVRPGTSDILKHVNAVLGYDFTPYLPALWFDDESACEKARADYSLAVNHRLEETYYAPLWEWCEKHGVWLMGHPAQPDEIGLMRYFHVPGQDLVWRMVMPNEPSALEGPQSTQAKCSSSAMIHLGQRRNSNEFCGAYGHSLSFAEMQWLADWCFIRGVNLLIPHAFYYSTRGPRRDERPPDVGPNRPWWNSGFGTFAQRCAELAWLNTDSQHVCDVAILGWPNHLPWRAARACFERQIDFNYLDIQDLLEGRAVVNASGVQIGSMSYKVIILDQGPDSPPVPPQALRMLEPARLIHFLHRDHLIEQIDRWLVNDITLYPPQPGVRYRHVIKQGRHYRMFFNESATGAVSFRASSPDGWSQAISLDKWELNLS